MRWWIACLTISGVALIAVPLWLACYKLNLTLLRRQHLLDDDADYDDETQQDHQKEEMDYGEAVKKEIKFPEFYHVTGVLRLPFDEIVEPFEAWYAGKYNMSRIDYYYGKQLHFYQMRLIFAKNDFFANKSSSNAQPVIFAHKTYFAVFQ